MSKIILYNEEVLKDSNQLNELLKKHPTKVVQLIPRGDLLQAFSVMVQEFGEDYDLLSESINLGMLLHDFAIILGMTEAERLVLFGMEFCAGVEAILNATYTPLTLEAVI